MTNIELDNTLPAYIRLKFAKKCSVCFEVIPVGELAFWFGKDKKAYHGKCGSPKWKENGTPYSIRRSAAMVHQSGVEQVPPPPKPPTPKPIAPSDTPKYNKAKFSVIAPRWATTCTACHRKITKAGYWFKNKDKYHQDCYCGDEINTDSGFKNWLEMQANQLLKKK